jgi:hypothetical protein
LFERLGINIGASGSCIIDVGGKDELGVFYKLCKSLKINCRIIADLDAVFRGRLRRVVCEDDRSQAYVHQQGIGLNLSKVIGDLETQLSGIATRILSQVTTIPHLIELQTKIRSLTVEEEHSKRVSTLLAINKYEADVRTLLDHPNMANLNLILGRLNQLHNGFKSCNTFIFSKGEIEHYYTQSVVDYLNISNKDTWFHAERDYLLQAPLAELEQNYAELIPILKEAVPVVEIEMKKHLKFEIFEWIHRVQTGIAKGEINNADDLTRNAKINYNLYSQILELQSLTINANKTFDCQINIRESLIGTPLTVTFTQITNAHDFDL